MNVLQTGRVPAPGLLQYGFKYLNNHYNSSQGYSQCMKIKQQSYSLLINEKIEDNACMVQVRPLYIDKGFR